MSERRAFVLLEVLTCLAIVGILLPAAHRFVIAGQLKCRDLLLTIQASRQASLEIRRMELELEGMRPPDLEFIGSATLSQGVFHVERRVRWETERLATLDVVVRWQSFAGPREYRLEQAYFVDCPAARPA